MYKKQATANPYDLNQILIVNGYSYKPNAQAVTRVVLFSLNLHVNSVGMCVLGGYFEQISA